MSSQETRVSFWQSLWRTLIRFEAEKMAPGLALRNTIGVLIPISLGVAVHQLAAGLIMSSGALYVAFSDGPEPYRHRGRRMLKASLLVSVAVFIGGLSDLDNALAVGLATAWAFAAGMMVALGVEEGDLGSISLVTLVVYGAQQLTPENAAYSGLLAFGGGLLQTGMALLLWPLRRHTPERRNLGLLFLEIAKNAESPVKVVAAPPSSAHMVQAQRALTMLAKDHSIEADRSRSLLAQGERIRLTLLMLGRLTGRLRREPERAAQVADLENVFASAARVVRCIGEAIQANRNELPKEIAEWNGLLEGVLARQPAADATSFLDAVERDIRLQLQALGGQLRIAADLAFHTTAEGNAVFEQREARKSWRLRAGSMLETLRANLTLDSAAFRHAVRLAVTIGLGDALGRGLGWSRPYWIPMTIAIVLRPDFATTFSRGVLRLAGTLAGLALATVLFHVVSPTLPEQVALLGVFMFALRAVGPANYGIFVIAISTMVVLLVGFTGVAPNSVVVPRALNTAIGGGLALLAYAAWPTWERTQVAEAMARMLASYRAYFRAVAGAYLGRQEGNRLDAARQDARLARQNAEASVDRLGTEPGTSKESIEALNGMLASSHRFVHAAMALEAGLTGGYPGQGETFQVLTDHVDLTLYLLAARLRGVSIGNHEFPDLRQDHDNLVAATGQAEARFALVNVEADRVVNSADTLAEQVMKWTA